MKGNVIADKLSYFHRTGKKTAALLIDPAHVMDEEDFAFLIETAVSSEVGFFFIGGSLASHDQCRDCIQFIKSQSELIPTVLFPGNAIQVVGNADGILFMTLISGRNPDFLIGQHVIAAPFLIKTSLEVLATGYLLVDGGEPTSVNYVSQTLPLPRNKPDLAIATALAGRMLGLRYFYIDAGSGAKKHVSPEIISGVKSHTNCPLIVGGGIDSVDKAKMAWDAGADIIVLGNGVEKKPNLLTEVLALAKMHNLSLNVN